MPDTGEDHIQSWQASGWNNNNNNKSQVSGMMAYTCNPNLGRLKQKGYHKCKS